MCQSNKTRKRAVIITRYHRGVIPEGSVSNKILSHSVTKWSSALENRIGNIILKIQNCNIFIMEVVYLSVNHGHVYKLSTEFYEPCFLD